MGQRVSFLEDRTIEHLRGVVDWPDATGTRYRIVELIGRGGMGSVYQAHDIELDRPVALKVLREPEFDADGAERMLTEARVIARLEHPGIIPVHDLGKLADGRTYYAMKLVRGKRLDEHFDAEAGLSDRLRVFERICETVAFAHSHGVIHRDLKPGNVMVGAFGEVLVLDWGLAKLRGRRGDGSADSPAAAIPSAPAQRHSGAVEPPAHLASGEQGTVTHRTAEGVVLGTPAFMAPEQARGDVDQVDERTDVFGLGGILYYLLTGRAPMESAEAGQARSIRPPRQCNRSIPKPLDAICAKALSSAPRKRYAGANDLRRDIVRFLDGQPVAAYRETPLEHAGRIAKKYRTPILLVGAYLVMRLLLAFLPAGKGNPGGA